MLTSDTQRLQAFVAIFVAHACLIRDDVAFIDKSAPPLPRCCCRAQIRAAYGAAAAYVVVRVAGGKIAPSFSRSIALIFAFDTPHARRRSYR